MEKNENAKNKKWTIKENKRLNRYLPMFVTC